MDELTMILLKIVVSVCAALITAYVVPYIKALKQDSRYAAVIDMIELAVRAAEQTIREPGQGKAKKEEVIRFISDWMTKNGIQIDDSEIDQLIESCVYQLKQEQK